MNNYEEELRQLLGAFQQNQQPQGTTPLVQGLLGSAGGGQQAQQLQDIIAKGQQAAAQMQQPQMQPANSGDLAQRQAMTQQMGQQAIQQQAQNQAQAGSLLGSIASLFMPGGSVLGYFKGKKQG